MYTSLYLTVVVISPGPDTLTTSTFATFLHVKFIFSFWYLITVKELLPISNVDSLDSSSVEKLCHVSSTNTFLTNNLRL